MKKALEAKARRRGKRINTLNQPCLAERLACQVLLNENKRQRRSFVEMTNSQQLSISSSNIATNAFGDIALEIA